MIVTHSLIQYNNFYTKNSSSLLLHNVLVCLLKGDMLSILYQPLAPQKQIVISNWFLGKPAALDVSITSPLNPLTLLEAGVLAKSAAQVTEARKHQANDPKCLELGWVCVPMVAESYGAWGDEASSIISSIASRLATSTCKSKSVVLNDIYARL